MKKKAITGMILSLLLTSMLAMAFNVAVVTADPEEGLLLFETDKVRMPLGEAVNITLTNIGDVYVQIGGWPSCMIYTYPDLEPVWPKTAAFLLWGLNPGESETWTWYQNNAFTGLPAEPGTYIVKFMGVLYTPSEVNEVIFYIGMQPIPGDIDGDGDIDLDDFAIFAGAYGTSTGQPAYKKVADLNSDGTVNLDDFAAFAGKYGQSW